MSSEERAGTRPGGHRSASRSSPARAVGIAATALAVCLFLALPGYGDSTKIVDIEIRNGKVVGKKSVRVVKGDTVTLRWRSDQQLALHLHGYDVNATVSPAAPAEMRIRARATGRFPVEIHGQRESGGHGHKAIFYLEVYPD
jgi:hypothetical protein